MRAGSFHEEMNDKMLRKTQSNPWGSMPSMKLGVTAGLSTASWQGP